MTLRQRTFAAAATVVALLLAGCTSSVKESTGSSTQGSNPDSNTVQAVDPAGFDDYYNQEINWEKCDADQVVSPMMQAPSDISSYECATLQAPMNWDDPDSEPIELAVARYTGKKLDKKLPPLFFNLGGPGGGAVDSLASFVENILTPQMAQKYQTIALDPRGVGASSPIWCLTDEERDESLAEFTDTEDWSTEQLVALYQDDTAEFGNQCLERNGEILGYVDSDSATRDFDMVRSALGAETIDYLGFSYGTVLGAIYADLFPGRVGHFVLDGAVDPSLNINELSALQIEGMEKSLYHWIEECEAESNCPLSGGLEGGKEQMIEFFDQVSENPIPTSDPDRPLDGAMARTAVIGSLYSTELYPLLSQSVRMAMNGDGSAMQFLADYFNDRGDDGVYISNSSDAFMAVNMLDYEPVGTPEEWQATYDELVEKYPVVGSDFGLASAGMDKWPVETRALRQKVTAKGAGEILVIGTTNDPATPYVMAEALADALEGGVLITVEGWDHTAYSNAADPCVTGAVDNFMLNGTIPEDGLVCPGE